MTWKEQQRALAEKTKLCHVHSKHDRAKVGTILKFQSGAYQVQPNGSLRAVTLPKPAAA